MSTFPRNLIRTIRYIRVLGPYISEIGRVAFVSVVIFGLLAAICEAYYPGFVINWISPKSIIQLGIIAGFLALWPIGMGTEKSPGWLEGLIVLFFSVAAFLVAWYYFKPIVDSQIVVSLSAAFAVGLSFCLLIYGNYSKKQ